MTSTSDPWIDAYLAFRQAVLDDELPTLDDVRAYVSELKHGLPTEAPSIPAAMFIHADIAVTFPGAESSPELVSALWIPHGSRR